MPTYKHIKYCFFFFLLSLYFSRREKAAVQPVTRATTGKLPVHRTTEASTPTAAGPSKAVSSTPTAAPGTPVVNSKQIVVGHKATSEEIKERMEQQLRLQRAAHHKRRALEMQKNNGKWYIYFLFHENSFIYITILCIASK